VARLVVCNPRKNALLESGNKGDLIDARKLAELLRNHSLSAVYHRENSALEMQHRTRSYTTLTEDTTRVMSRLKALFRSQAIHCPGKKLFRPYHRESYLSQLGSEVCGNEPSASTWNWTPCTQCGCGPSARWFFLAPCFFGPSDVVADRAITQENPGFVQNECREVWLRTFLSRACSRLRDSQRLSIRDEEVLDDLGS
jgi:hypothetical protein